MQALDELKAEATAAIESAGDSAELERLRVEWLGKKGRVTDLLNPSVSWMPPSDLKWALRSTL